MVVLKSSVSNYINLDNKTYSYFGGNNYLGLANHPDLIREVVAAVEKYGVNFSASRQTTGTSELHLELEKQLSDFNGKESSVVFASGYMGNHILLDILKHSYSAIYYDELSHPSFLDGIPAGVTNLFKFKHCDAGSLETLLKKNNDYKPLIFTDGVFALTGEIAPLDQIFALAKEFNATIIIDDAHSAGVLGSGGKGTAEHFSLDGESCIYQSGTLSKAFGAYGGFISADKRLVSSIRQKSSAYMASTALPPPIAAAGSAALRIVQQHPEMRENLLLNADIIRKGIIQLDFNTSPGGTPIIPLFFDTEENATELPAFLKEHSIVVPYVKYPLKTDKFIVRITASAIHTADQIDYLLSVLKKWREKHGSNKD